ncbi:MAG: hypothetical protein ACRDK4_05380 [Solirubrobacteraceae bacterium]
MSVLLVLILIAAAVTFFMLRSGENLRFETSADPYRVIVAAIGIVSAKRCWEITAQSERGANFKYHKQPKVLVAILLLLCFFIPGIVYVFLAGKRESLVLSIDTGTSGPTVVQITSNGFRGKAAGRALARQISVPAGACGTGATPALTS